MSYFHYVWAFILAIVLLVFVHEFGHFLAARLCGVKVLRFSLGFGPVVFSRIFGRDKTEWVLSAIPLGGYVKMLDEGEGKVDEKERHRAFNIQPVYKRSIVVLAGPLTNLLLAILIYWVIFISGSLELAPILGQVREASPASQAGLVEGDRILEVDGQAVQSWSDARWVFMDRGADKATVDLKVRLPSGSQQAFRLDLSKVVLEERAPDVLDQLGLSQVVIKSQPILGEIMRGSAGERAQLLSGDRILAVDGQPINSLKDFADYIALHANKVVHIDLKRAGLPMTLEATPAEIDVDGKPVGRLGVELKADPAVLATHMVVVRYSPIEALYRASKQTWDTSVFSLKVVGKMLTGQLSIRNISGPVTIADYAGQTAKMGLGAYFKFVALMSISLGVLNLMPIPVLDGGHLLYYGFEKILGRPLPVRIMEWGQKAGLLLLLCLMGLAFFNDFARFNF